MRAQSSFSWPAHPTLMDRMHRTAVLAMSYVHVARVLCTVCVLYGTGTRFVSAWCRVRVCVRYNILSTIVSTTRTVFISMQIAIQNSTNQ